MFNNPLELEMQELSLRSDTSQQLSEEILRRIRESNDAKRKALEKVDRWAIEDLEAIFKDSKPENPRLG